MPRATRPPTLDRRHFTVVRPRHIYAFTLLPEHKYVRRSMILDSEHGMVRRFASVAESESENEDGYFAARPATTAA